MQCKVQVSEVIFVVNAFIPFTLFVSTFILSPVDILNQELLTGKDLSVSAV